MEYQINNRSEQALLQTIAHIELRLADLGNFGSCAYERALEHSYRELLSCYWRKLFLLQSRLFLLLEPSAIIAQGKTA